MKIDMEKQRREFGRWVLLLGLYNAHPEGMYEEPLLWIMHGIYRDATKAEVRRELDYLLDRGFVEIKKEPGGRWKCDINRHGVDFVEYNMEAQPGIARPPKDG